MLLLPLLAVLLPLLQALLLLLLLASLAAHLQAVAAPGGCHHVLLREMSRKVEV